MPSNFNRMTVLSLTCTCMVLFGCDSNRTSDERSPITTLDSHDDHDHSSTGPHHGLLIELGSDDYHAEIVHDDASGSVTVYLLDAAAKQLVTSDVKEVMINIQKGDRPAQFALTGKAPNGQAATEFSEYTVASKELLELLHDHDVTAKLNVTIAGQPFSGKIPHDVHAGHDHH